MKPRIVMNGTHWLCYDSAHRGLVGIGATPAQAFETYQMAMRRAAVRRQMEAMGPASIRYEDRLVTGPVSEKMLRFLSDMDVEPRRPSVFERLRRWFAWP